MRRTGQGCGWVWVALVAELGCAGSRTQQSLKWSASPVPESTRQPNALLPTPSPGASAAARGREQPPAVAPSGTAPASSGAVPAGNATPVTQSVSADAPSEDSRLRGTASVAPSPQHGDELHCPAGMMHVRHDYCPELDRVCVRSEYDKPNHLTICHQFQVDSNTCLAPRVKLDFCIDEYEYPNQLGAHPPVMVDWHKAGILCAQLGKRLCYEREWVAACEGPGEQPFPYGWERSAQKCNFDNRWIEPELSRVYSSHPEIQQKELKRLDQSVPSGAKPECVSGYGVHDLTGNFDEWVNADRPRPKTKAGESALKGGAWGHVRNACRPVTTSHAPEFTYYFVSFRCCQDPIGSTQADTETGVAPRTEPR